MGNIGTGEGATVVIGGHCDDALVAALSNEGLEVVASATTAHDVERFAFTRRPAVVLLDHDLPGNALRVADDMSAKEIGVAVRGPVDNELELFAALAAGATGYVDTAAVPSSVAKVATVVAAGGVAIPRMAEPALVGRVRSLGGSVEVELGGRVVTLTHREWEVLLFLRHGRSTSEIAGRLYVSKATVRTFVSSLLRQTGAKDRDALTSLIQGGRVARDTPGDGARLVG